MVSCGKAEGNRGGGGERGKGAEPSTLHMQDFEEETATEEPCEEAVEDYVVRGSYVRRMLRIML